MALFIHHGGKMQSQPVFFRGFSVTDREYAGLAYSITHLLFILLGLGLGLGLYCSLTSCVQSRPFNHVTIKHEGSVGHRGPRFTGKVVYMRRSEEWTCGHR